MQLEKIRFRAMSNTQKSWVYSTLVYPQINHKTIISAWQFERHIQGNHLDPLSRGQSTGKQYENKEDIYTGDIVRYCEDFDYIYVVKYIEEDCQFRAIGVTKTQSENSLGYKLCDRLVKIGTVYENSELLEEKANEL